MRLNEFNHSELACDVARDFGVAYRDVEALYGRGAMRRIPLFGVGHSLGAKVHVLLNSYPDVVEVAKRRKVRGGFLFFRCLQGLPSARSFNSPVKTTVHILWKRLERF